MEVGNLGDRDEPNQTREPAQTNGRTGMQMIQVGVINRAWPARQTKPWSMLLVMGTRMRDSIAGQLELSLRDSGSRGQGRDKYEQDNNHALTE